MVLTHTATREGKLLSFLRNELSLSYGLIKRLKYQKAYQVNATAARTNHPIHPGDVITVQIDEAPPCVPAEDDDLSILYEDETIIVLDKPPGLIMHPTFNRIEGTLANRLLGYYRRTGQKSSVHFVSRLDRDTKGAVLIAKNAHIHAVLCDPARIAKIQKTYHAAIYGHPPTASGTICAPIARLSPVSLLRCVREDGKRAESAYTVLRETKSCALLQMQPKTGRTHQLRVHCAHEGFPILGDMQYGTEESTAFSLDAGYAHQQLCAVSLVFPHPMTGREEAIHSRMDVHLPEK